jgi:hypothetical protein
MTGPSDATPDRSRGRLLLLAGLALPALGVAAYAAQLYFSRLILPWYMPALALLGVVLVALSLRRRRTVWRALALAAVVLFAGAEAAALNAMRLPPYAGPVTVGRPFPAFEAKRADGSAFTQDDLIGDQNVAFVFFRGRW